MSERCVICNRRFDREHGHKCPKSVLALYDQAERLADLAEDPEEPGLDPIDPRQLRRFRSHGLILEFE
jgi:hypothetical protein